jgi:hypothetical protein
MMVMGGIVMKSITIPATVVAELQSQRELVEVRGPDGEIIGYFAPVAQEHAAKYADTAAKAHSVGNKPAGAPITTAELLNRLGAMGQR